MIHIDLDNYIKMENINDKINKSLKHYGCTFVFKEDLYDIFNCFNCKEELKAYLNLYPLINGYKHIGPHCELFMDIYFNNLICNSWMYEIILDYEWYIKVGVLINIETPKDLIIKYKLVENLIKSQNT